MKDRTSRFLMHSAMRSLAAFFIVVSLFAALRPQIVQAATFTVTKTADTNDGVCNSDCSLREAISAANASPGPDTITLPAGTYLLTLNNAGGTNEDANASGDLDVLDSLTIQGAGSGTTIIEAGTNNANGIDKVLALNPICSTAINVTIDGVTIRFGRNTQPSNASDFSFTGGGIDWCSAGAGGTFNLSNSVVSDNTNVNGYGGGLNVDTVSSPTTVNITNTTFSNNQTLNATQTATGGAINLFGDSPTINITNSTFTGNHTTNPTSGGGAIYFRPTTVGHLSISGSTFTTNTAAGIGGAIATDSHGAASTISIQNSTFTGNTATNSFGGALDLNGTNLTTTPFSLSHLIITGNTAGNSGGGVYIGASNVSLSNSLIVGNNAPTGSGIHKSADVATATVTNNWWGCSTGPGAAPCDRATTSGGTLNFTPWYRNQLTAATSPIVTNQSTALTTSFLTNSANSAVPVADLTEIIGRPVTWAATGGILSGTQGTIQATATAAGSFQASSVGAVVISTIVDNDNTSPVNPNVLSLSINKADTTVAITNASSLSSTHSVTGQPVAINFSVTGAFGNSPTAPTGSVTVSDGTISCTGTLASGSCNLTFTSAGSKTLTATYNGDSNFNASPASASAAHTVNKADTTTIITSDNPDPSTAGQVVTVNYSVAVNSPGAGTLTGNVTVSDGVDSCTGTVSAGTCSITLTTSGSRTLTASYTGDSNFNGSTSAGEPHTVGNLGSITSISLINPATAFVGQSVTVSYLVNPQTPGSGTPTGNVTVTDGTISCTGTVAAGQCSLTFTSAGGRTITATYAGDSTFQGSTSASVPYTVLPADTITTITSDSPDPSNLGQAVTVNYTVTAQAPGAGTPTGNVTVSDGVDSCTGTVSAGTCSITLTTPGARTLTAAYAGSSNFNASTSAGEPHVVNAIVLSVTINQASGQADPTNASPIHFTAVFSQPVTGFTGADLTLINATSAVVTQIAPNDGTTYDVAVSGMSTLLGSIVTATIPANVATDSLGNPNLASTSTDNSVTFLVLPDLSITKSHSGDFTQLSSGSYTITVSNSGGSPTSGTVQVVDSLPAGLSATALSGTGWNCALNTLTCTRSNALAAGNSYPAITLTVNVALTAQASLTNTATVSGGGEQNISNDTATDPTTILPVSTFGQITPANATCAQFAAHTALDLTQLIYTVNNNKVKSVTPSSFLYFAKVIAPTPIFIIKVNQANNAGWPNLDYTHNFNLPQIYVYNADCKLVLAVPIITSSSVFLTIPKATVGGVYYVSIRYQADHLVGKAVSTPYPTVPYTFTTAVNGSPVPQNTDSISLKPQ